MRNAENVGVTTRRPKYTFDEMLNAIGDCLFNLASSDDQQQGEEEKNDQDHTELGKLGEDVEPG